ncbi:hypothetical protein [Kitasatospora sp. NPDC091207]|uniref:hypothetical protein n=1 Tax=Kitasatospora sp. NPDC091207 TaxID=3364083 RepID=UPI0038144779
MLALAAEDEAEPAADAVLTSPAYRRILAAFERTAHGVRAKDLCQALDAALEPKQIEGMRAKLKRLVARSILTEPEPGPFTLPRPKRRRSHRPTASGEESGEGSYIILSGFRSGVG